MKVKYDFTLNTRHFGIVEQAIMRLVLNGFRSAPSISGLLWVFSDEVKANAIQNLVNSQLLRASLSSKELFLSDGLRAIIDVCNNNTYELDLPESLLSQTTESAMIIEDAKVTAGILQQIVPEANLNHLAKSLWFSVSVEG